MKRLFHLALAYKDSKIRCLHQKTFMKQIRADLDIEAKIFYTVFGQHANQKRKAVKDQALRKIKTQDLKVANKIYQ